MGRGMSTGLGVRRPVNEPTCSSAFGKACLKHPVCPLWAVLALVCWEGLSALWNLWGGTSPPAPHKAVPAILSSHLIFAKTGCVTQLRGLRERTLKFNLVMQVVRKMGSTGRDPIAGTWGSRAQRMLAELGEGGQVLLSVEGRTGQAGGRPPPGGQATAFVQ